MKSTGKEKVNLIKSQNKFINVKSNYILKNIFKYLQKGKSLKIIRYNTNIKKRLNITIDDYKSIVLEIIPYENQSGEFININGYNKKYFHIYFNDDKEEIKVTNLSKEDKVSKINVVNMGSMFYKCSSIKELNLNNFNTNNVTDMNCMFYGCLDELKLKIKSQFKIFKGEAFKN